MYLISELVKSTRNPSLRPSKCLKTVSGKTIESWLKKPYGNVIFSGVHRQSRYHRFFRRSRFYALGFYCEPDSEYYEDYAFDDNGKFLFSGNLK